MGRDELLDALARRQPVDLSRGGPSVDDVRDALCDPSLVAHSSPLELVGGTIDDRFTLDYATLIRPLHLREVRLLGGLDLTEASVPSIRIQDSTLGEVIGDRVRIAHVLYLKQSLVVRQISLIECEVGDALNLSGTKVFNAGKAGTAVNLYCARLNGGAYLENMRVRGLVRLIDSRTAGILSLSGTQVRNGTATAILAERLRAPSMFLRRVRVVGRASLLGANIDGTLSLTEARITRPNETALNLDAAKIGARLVLRSASIEGDLLLRSTQVEAIVDDRESWMACDRIETDGLRFNRLGGGGSQAEGEENDGDPPLAGQPLTVAERIKYLCQSNVGYSPTPYAQLRHAYTTSGDDSAATTVAIAGSKDRLTRGVTEGLWPTVVRVGGRPFGYGFHPFRAVWLLLAVIAAYAALVGLDGDALTPTTDQPDACQGGQQCLVPLAYAADVVLPIIDLDQQSAWVIDPEEAGADLLRVATWLAIVLAGPCRRSSSSACSGSSAHPEARSGASSRTRDLDLVDAGSNRAAVRAAPLIWSHSRGRRQL